MNDITVLNFEQCEIRFVDGKPVANDVAAILGYKSSADAVYRRVDAEYKDTIKTITPGGMQSVMVLDEPGIYQLIFGSKSPVAKKFQKWILKNMRLINSHIPYSDFSCPTDNSGFVYLASAGTWYKIGMSKTPYKRMTSLQTGSPLEITLIHRIFTFDCKELEKALHDYYSAYWMRGEWFDLPQECVNEFPLVANQLDTTLEQSCLPTK
jgi:BRO family, N-terminal domain/Meiotically up-regulated gene 113